MMTVPIKKVPPPPPIAINDPVFNRWLHDITAFIAADGGIDTGNIPGYDVLVSTVDTHTQEIASLTINVSTLTSQVNINTNNISTNTSQISTLNTNVAALAARPRVWSGTTAPSGGAGLDSDWYADTSAKHIYVKVSGVWTLIV